MTNLPEVADWAAGIYQIEMTDPVLGGPPNIETGAGIANVQAKQLAERTAWLKAQIATAVATVIATGTGLDGGGSLDGGLTLSADLADKAIAEAGTNSLKLMTALRTKQAIDVAIDALVGAAPAQLDTLNELATAISDNGDMSAALTALIGTKLDAASYTASDVLAKLLTVDGAGSGLNADKLDGVSSGSFVKTSRSITAGSGLTGGGALGGDMTISASIATQAQAEAGTDNARLMTSLRTHQAIKALQSNALPTAWVNFNGQGTVAIREAFNVSSNTDLGAEVYRANFANQMANTNYAVFPVPANALTVSDERNFTYLVNKTLSYVEISNVNFNGVPGDWDNVSILIMGGAGL
ncbi:hypothetical protein [Parasedimentitalea huanghaiensis]|uniref:Uncharacterized protein n=1 Tax=Parasedimentitalea huanghaiensis TaxID=2682100 RepID=A0A6L6WG16_9RHOB|nr:hypothetical protein [Zongyanglinia huanghaiensis]MVO16218.1 hypothetical protein [Zongyanglinia huanghaiensis]